MRTHLRLAATVLAASLALAACGGSGSGSGTDAGAGDASVAIAAPEDGATVTSPVTVEMTADGIDVQPAGEVVEGAGHFHVMVDTDCLAPGETIPKDDTHQHFGDGSTTAELELEPGEHTLCLQAGDGAHAALDATDTVTITVE